MSSNASLPLLLKQLKLVTIYQHLDEITQKATQEGWGYHTYLSKLLGLEVDQRESKRIERYLKEAKLPTGKLVILQSNNYFDIPEHVNCVQDIKQFEQMTPMQEVYFTGELKLEKYTRYMRIGIR